MFTKSVCAVGALVFIAGSHAHIIMNTPTPYGFSTLQTSPLNGEGYDFPCQSGSRTDAFDAEGASNPMAVGEDNDLKFTGSAVHGGGSCQLSVTYDNPPPADKSKWKVIHSFIGSCPAEAAGNIQSAGTDSDGRPTGPQCTSDDETECLRQFKFQIPEGMKNGNATLAWTWFNKLGNREMYMNCAPISISGGSDDDTYFNSLPELFVANIPGECTTSDSGGVIGFPNPGDQVTYGEAITSGVQGSCPAASSGNSSSTDSESSSTAAASSYAASPAAVSSAYVASDSASVSLTLSVAQNAKTTASAVAIAAAVTADDATSAGQSTTLETATGYAPAASSPVADSYSAAAYPTAVSTGDASSSSSSNGTCEAGKVSCPTPGAIICVGDSEFGLCNIDYCAVPEALAAGTTCSSGVISKRDVVRRSSSRFRRHVSGHAHKHHF